MLSLAISLGHNSSAVLIENGAILCGYEEERFTGVKAESRYPKNAIDRCLKFATKPLDDVCISHWATYGLFLDMNDKHFDGIHLTMLLGPDTIIHSHDEMFTHHDAHMEVARVYSGPIPVHTIVADGFGNFNEVLSIYKNDKLIYRSHGYGKSLGLFYQYTTAFLGMKMNQDEYKLLGYEAHILDVLNDYPQTINDVRHEAEKIARRYYRALMKNQPGYALDSLLDTGALIKTRQDIEKKWKQSLYNLKFKIHDKFHLKVIISFMLQTAVESVLSRIIEKFDIKSVNLVGGIFYNVKLNKAIMDSVDKICICPLAGDQGAGLGVYQHTHKDLHIDSLCIGPRLIYIDKISRMHNHSVFTVNSILSANRSIIDLLNDDYIVNVIYGNMEFGPRALGNTTTLMKPTLENVKYINHCNGRNTIMPCAPITVNIEQFLDYDKVIRSLDHMIITLEYAKEPQQDLLGAAHQHPTDLYYTGRPQWINRNHFLYETVKVFGTLVNTSFNIHGQPIIYSVEQLKIAIEYQQKRDTLDRIRTIMIL